MFSINPDPNRITNKTIRLLCVLVQRRNDFELWNFLVYSTNAILFEIFNSGFIKSLTDAKLSSSQIFYLLKYKLLKSEIMPKNVWAKNRAVKQWKLIINFMRKCNQHRHYFVCVYFPKSKLVLDQFYWVVLISLLSVDDSFHYYSNSS